MDQGNNTMEIRFSGMKVISVKGNTTARAKAMPVMGRSIQKVSFCRGNYTGSNVSGTRTTGKYYSTIVLGSWIFFECRIFKNYQIVWGKIKSSLWLSGNFVKGKLEGLGTEFYNDGSPCKAGKWKNGIPDMDNTFMTHKGFCVDQKGIPYQQCAYSLNIYYDQAGNEIPKDQWMDLFGAEFYKYDNTSRRGPKPRGEVSEQGGDGSNCFGNEESSVEARSDYTFREGQQPRNCETFETINADVSPGKSAEPEAMSIFSGNEYSNKDKKYKYGSPTKYFKDRSNPGTCNKERMILEGSQR
jgi:hypothetical protein